MAWATLKLAYSISKTPHEIALPGRIQLSSPSSLLDRWVSLRALPLARIAVGSTPPNPPNPINRWLVGKRDDNLLGKSQPFLFLFGFFRNAVVIRWSPAALSPFLLLCRTKTTDAPHFCSFVFAGKLRADGPTLYAITSPTPRLIYKGSNSPF